MGLKLWPHTNSHKKVRNNTARDSSKPKVLGLTRKKHFFSPGPYCSGGQAGGREKTHDGPAGGMKNDAKAADSNRSSTSSLTIAAAATTKCSKCQAKGHPHTVYPKQRCANCEGNGHSAEVCPNIAMAVMVYEELSDG